MCRRALPLAAGADVLVHESTFGPDESQLAKQYYHSTNLQAAELAKRAGVGRLLLNHISARYLGPGVAMLEKVHGIFSRKRMLSEIWRKLTFHLQARNCNRQFLLNDDSGLMRHQASVVEDYGKIGQYTELKCENWRRSIGTRHDSLLFDDYRYQFTLTRAQEGTLW